MLFTSFVFLAFLLAILAVYWLLPGPETQNFLLLFGSLAFYAWGEPRLVVLILVCALTGFLCGLMIERRSDLAGWFVALGSTVAFGILFTFKYFDFFVESIEPSTACEALGFAAAHSECGEHARGLHERCGGYVVDHFAECIVEPSFLELPCEAVAEVIGSEDLAVEEAAVLGAVRAWFDHDAADRQASLPALVPLVRWPQLPVRTRLSLSQER